MPQLESLKTALRGGLDLHSDFCTGTPVAIFTSMLVPHKVLEVRLGATLTLVDAYCIQVAMSCCRNIEVENSLLSPSKSF